MQRYQNVAYNGSTNQVIPTPTITVYLPGTTTTVTIYSDEGTTPKANPFSGDAFGRYDFYVADGDYDIKVEGTGVSAYTLGDVTIVDPKKFIRGEETGLKIVRGRIDTTGAGSILQGGGFTIVRNGVGDLTVTFSPAFSGVPSCVPAGESTSAFIHARNKAVPTASTMQVQVFATANTGTVDETHQPVDGIFHFIAAGPR